MRARDRAGFTLIEVLIAITMLAIVTLGLMAASGRMIRTVSDDRVRTVASTAADARIAMIRAWPAYATLDSVYAGIETGQPLPGWTRTTTIVRTGGAGQPNDFKRATVVVAGPGLTSPVQRTVTIAAP
jgi:type II secretion system protein I